MSDYTDEANQILMLIVSAAAKQTIGSQAARNPSDATMASSHIAYEQGKNNASAVGRLHNAAKRARAILPADVVADLERQARGE